MTQQAVRPDEVGADGYALTVPGPGRYLIRMRYSPYLRIVAGEGCLEPQGDVSTLLTVRWMKRMNPERFYVLVYVLMVLLGAKLFWDGVHG